MKSISGLLQRTAVIGGLMSGLIGCEPRQSTDVAPSPDTRAAEQSSDVAAASQMPPTTKSLEEQTADAVAGFLTAMFESGAASEGIRQANGIFYTDDLDIFQHDFGYLLVAHEAALKDANEGRFRRLVEITLQKKYPDLAARVAQGEFDEPLRPVLHPSNGYSLPEKPLKEEPTQWCGDFIARYLQAYDLANSKRRQAFLRLVAQAKLCFPLMEKQFGKSDVVEFRDLSSEELSQLAAIVKRHRPEAADMFTRIVLAERANTVKSNQNAVQRTMRSLWFGQQRIWRDDIDGNGVHDFQLGDWRPVLSAVNGENSFESNDDRTFAERYGYDIHVIRRGPAAPETSAASAKQPPRDRRYFAYAATPVKYGAGARQTLLIDDRGILWTQDTEGQKPDVSPQNPEKQGWAKVEDDGDRPPAGVSPQDVAALSLETAEEKGTEVLRGMPFDSSVWSATPQVVALLKSSSAAIRTSAAEAIGKLGPRHDAPVDALLPLLDDESEEVRRATITALGQLEDAAAPAVGKLGGFVRADEPLRIDAVVALARIGRDAKPAESVLRPLLNEQGDQGADLRIAAAAALWRIGRTDDDLIPHLIDGLLRYDPVRQISTQALREIGEKAVEALAKIAADPNAAMRWEAEDLLTSWGAAAKSAVPTIFRLAMTESEIANRNEHLGKLQYFGPAAASVVPELTTLLKSPTTEPATVIIVCGILRNVGPEAASAAPALASLLDPPNVSSDEAASTAVLSALGAIGPKAAVSLPAMENAAKSRPAPIASAALDALGNLGPEAAPAVPMLIEKLSQPNLRPFAVAALGKIGPAAQAALPALRSIRDDFWMTVIEDPSTAERLSREVRRSIRAIEGKSATPSP